MAYQFIFNFSSIISCWTKFCQLQTILLSQEYFQLKITNGKKQLPFVLLVVLTEYLDSFPNAFTLTLLSQQVTLISNEYIYPTLQNDCLEAQHTLQFCTFS